MVDRGRLIKYFQFLGFFSPRHIQRSKLAPSQTPARMGFQTFQCIFSLLIRLWIMVKLKNSTRPTDVESIFMGRSTGLKVNGLKPVFFLQHSDFSLYIFYATSPSTNLDQNGSSRPDQAHPAIYWIFQERAQERRQEGLKRRFSLYLYFFPNIKMRKRCITPWDLPFRHLENSGTQGGNKRA